MLEDENSDFFDQWQLVDATSDTDLNNPPVMCTNSFEQETSRDDLCTPSPSSHTSNSRNFGLSLAYGQSMYWNQNSNSADISTTMNLFLSTDQHDYSDVGMASTSEEHNHVYNDVYAHFDRPKDDANMVLQQEGSELCKKFEDLSVRERYSIEIHYEQIIMQKNRAIEELSAEIKKLKRSNNEMKTEVDYWRGQYNEMIDIELSRKKQLEQTGEIDAGSGVVGDANGDNQSGQEIICPICKKKLANMLCFPCPGLSAS